MSSGSARITLSLGRVTDGPRTAGDIRAIALSFILYQTWFLLAVLGAGRSVVNVSGVMVPGWLLGFGGIGLSTTFVFLIASVVSLLGFALLHARVHKVVPRRVEVCISGMLCIVGTAMTTILCSFAGDASPAVVFLGACLMGVGSATFIVLWGCVYSTLRFATAVINSVLSFALAFIAATLLSSWLPLVPKAIVEICLPIGFVAVFWRDDVCTLCDQIDVAVGYLRKYLVRLGACLLMLGVAVGALRYFCGTAMATVQNLSLELVLCAGCAVSLLVFVSVMLISHKESSWDYLFRMILPVCMLGIVFVAAPIGAEYATAFFLIVAFVCLDVLLWILLGQLAHGIEGSCTYVFGIGFAILQVGSVVGLCVTAALLGVGGDSSIAAELLGGIAGAGSSEGDAAGWSVGLVLYKYRLAGFALVLALLMSVGYSLLPRYYELRAILASMIGDLVTNARAAADSADDAEELGPGEAMGVDDVLEVDPEGESSAEYSLESLPDQEAADAEAEAEADSDLEELRVSRGSFKRRCDEIVRTYMLSERESEVMFLMAKGHNAAYVMDQLCISRSTVKTHINHIYKKIGIHTQQELLNMVEDRERGEFTPIGAEVDRELLRAAVERAKEEGPLESDPALLKQHIQDGILRP